MIKTIFHNIAFVPFLILPVLHCYLTMQHTQQTSTAVAWSEQSSSVYPCDRGLFRLRGGGLPSDDTSKKEGLSDAQKRIMDIETEMARTQKNKATMGHLCALKARLAALKRLVTEQSSSKSGGPGEGFEVLSYFTGPFASAQTHSSRGRCGLRATRALASSAFRPSASPRSSPSSPGLSLPSPPQCVIAPRRSTPRVAQGLLRGGRLRVHDAHVHPRRHAPRRRKDPGPRRRHRPPTRDAPPLAHAGRSPLERRRAVDSGRRGLRSCVEEWERGCFARQLLRRLRPRGHRLLDQRWPFSFALTTSFNHLTISCLTILFDHLLIDHFLLDYFLFDRFLFDHLPS